MNRFLFCAILLAGLLPTSMVIGGPFTISGNSSSGFSLSYQPGTPAVDSLHVDGSRYVRFMYDDHVTPETPGSPLLPSHTLYFGAPAGSIPQVMIADDRVTSVDHIRLIPTPSYESDRTGNPVEVYLEDTASYALSGPQPAEAVNIELTYTDGRLAVWRMTLAPLQYDAMDQTVYRHDGYTISVSFGSPLTTLGTVFRIPTYLLNYEILNSISAPVRAARIAALADNPFAEGDWYKLTLHENGMYKVTGAELAAAGVPMGYPSDWVHMYYGGGRMLPLEPSPPTTDNFRSIAIDVEDGGDGTFDSGDSIIFYGEALHRFDSRGGTVKPAWQNFLYADTGENVYWLKLHQETSPNRMSVTGETPSSGVTPITMFRDRMHLEPENYIEYIDRYGAETGTAWFWETLATTEEKTFTFNTTDVSDGPEPEIHLGFRNGRVNNGSSISVYKSNHTIYYGLNSSNLLGIISTFRTETGVTTVKSIPALGLVSGQNTLKMVRVITSVQHTATIRLDWMEVEYNRELKAPASLLQFYCEGTGEPMRFSMGNVNADRYNVYDTTDPFAVREVENDVFSIASHTLEFQITPDPGQWAMYTVVRNTSYKSISSITAKRQSNLRSAFNTADYILITPEVFSSEADDLVQWRSRDSETDPLASMKVLIEDVYNEFSWGIYDPVAIRDFLHYAHLSYNNGTRPVRYACLFGDTTYRFKNLQNQEEVNYIPSFTGFLPLATSPSADPINVFTDDFFTWFDTNGIPEISIGRFCVADTETAQLAVDKTIAYERDSTPGYWRNRVLLIADDDTGDSGYQKFSDTFTRDIESLDTGGYIPMSYERLKLLMIDYPMESLKKPTVTTDLFKYLNDGCLVVNYIGHGNNDVLSHEDVLRGSRDMDKFENGGRQPLFLALSCTVGKFDAPGIRSLAESLHLEPNGGSIASIASARYTNNPENVSMNKGFYSYLFDSEENPDHRIGTALLRAKQGLVGNSRTNSVKYFILGDPATRLSVPEYDIETSEIDMLSRLERPTIQTILAPDGVQDGPLTVTIKAFAPREHFIHYIGDIPLHYSTQNSIFYNATLTTDDPNFDFSFVVPKDVVSDISRDLGSQRESKIILYASGDGFESSGVIDGFLIGDIADDVPDDTTGPSFSLAFDGKHYSSGDVIRRQPELTVTISDPSGINIVGKRGHNITLLIDGADPQVLTDAFSYTSGFTTGSISYQLPVLDAGEHEFEITAYDTYNNVAKTTVQANVAGSLTGDIFIKDLLNYPNPMAGDGTSFTFTLTDYASHATIKIYSQSGRLVETETFPADYGYNQVEWHPSVDLANGVYFYKLSVTSSNGRKSTKTEKLVVMK